ncbi:hypothetical protein PLICRDRAFT_95023 [Plicaturopsis crispa FD-325 SS-3]|uniref:Unplaced genomic scaffold PLICRscaffold_16, whole genome shotgun sequence n=1 Tax=Plicaturopsis crispa FD-325 SS-3 TaxID=944288 RepID=A0A0C9SL55_PLICR|nr:hypothetical protein PLICRDRAFT_95023 [Plicaturopsis crispa FD-325 SS-3]
MLSNNTYERSDSQRLASSSQHVYKKRRVEPACDLCRQKKIRCDGQANSGKCPNCLASGSECTYAKPGRKKHEILAGSREDLERRLHKLEFLLENPRPSGDFSPGLGVRVHPSWFTDQDSSPSHVQHDISAPSLFSSTGHTPDATQSVEDSQSESDDIEETDFLTKHLEGLQLTDRFLGHSSGAKLINHVQEMKLTHGDVNHDQRPRPQIRTRFWRVKPWEQYAPLPERRDFFFPEPDLFAALVDIYFTRCNIYFPLLHRPTFERGVADGLHLIDDGFGATVLLVCALGSRHSSDPRVFLVHNETDLNSAGWKWFNQVQHRSSLYAPFRAYELQLICLSVMFLQASAAPHASWTLIGVGVRLAISSGAHRRKPTITAEDELWKRAFWVLVCLDRSSSASLGRPCPMQDKDFDLDLPKNCDDEYWENAEDPEQNFTQPPGKPAATHFFICLIKLNQIIARALDKIYPVDKSKVRHGYVKGWEQTIVAELDSALNEWLEEVPDHLRWDPTREDPLFFNQSASLYAGYYYVQILIHRPFIPSLHKASPVSFPSLAICTNAARSCSHAVLLQFERFSDCSLKQYAFPGLMSSTIVLLLTIWGGKRSGVSIDTTQEMATVHRCMDMLKSMEERWLGAGRLWDILSELVAVGDLPFPHSDLADSKKRRRGSESGNGPQEYSQPVQSNDLGTMPLQGPIDFDPVPTGMDFARWLSTGVPAQDNRNFASTVDQPLLYLSDSTPDSSETMPTTPFHQAPLDTFATQDLSSSSDQPSYPEQTGNNVPDAADVWSAALTDFELDEWGAYIMGMIEWE